jgi:phage shock protein PspC (stress-responsive transcriptional regulator)
MKGTEGVRLVVNRTGGVGVAKKLYRSRRERILGGVAGGLAEYFDVDVTLIRLAWVMVALAGGFGLLAYIAAWIIMPEEPEAGRRSRADAAEGGEPEIVVPEVEDAGEEADPGTSAEGEEREDGARGRSWFFGLFLVALGFYLLVQNLVPELQLAKFWPVALILLGGLILAGAFGRPKEG